MSYRVPLATPTLAGSVQIGTGLRINADGTLSTGGSAIEASTRQVTTPADGLVLVDSMTLTPGAGTYRVFFNATYSISSTPGDITALAAAEVDDLYTTLTGFPAGIVHGAVFGNGETLTPGVYDVASAADIQGVLTLDGLGDPTAVFIFRMAGALTSTSGASMTLINSVVPSNIFWLAEGAVALAANCILNGTFFAHNGAAGAGNGTGINGRLLSNNGAITTDANFIVRPVNPPPSSVPIGTTLDTFILFTSIGNLTNINDGTYLGNIGTNNGTITGYGVPTIVFGGIYPPGSLGPSTTAFSVGAYQNGILIPSSVREISGADSIGNRTVTLQTTATVGAGEAIEIRSQVDVGSLNIDNRDLTIFLA
jgi:hypothetical protein